MTKKAMKVRRCKGCKIYFREDQFEILKPFNNFHTVKCLQAWTAEQEKEKQKKEYFKKIIDRKPRKQSELARAKKRAVLACHAYVRYRDRDKPCICCGEPITDQLHAGHYLPAGNHSYIRYSEFNIHGQSLRCNYFKHGDSGNYRLNLIERIGIRKVEWLEANKNRRIKRTAEDYREIAKYYQEKLKKLQSE